MEKNYKKVGTIDLVSNSNKSAGLAMVMVSDPCYESEANFSLILEVESGIYNCLIETKDCGEWGNRISRMAILKDNFSIDFLNRNGVLENSVGVDSGTMSISDCFYYDKYHLNNENDDEIAKRNDSWYEKNVCGWAMRKRYHIADCFSFISNSGYGDGCYEVYSYTHNGTIVGIEVVFIDDDEDDE